MKLFKENVTRSQDAPASFTPDENGSVTAMTQDILILLLPFLSSEDASSLFQTCLSSDVLENKDNRVQKRGYKILAKLLDSGKVMVGVETVLGQLDDISEGLAPAAKKVRVVSLAQHSTLLILTRIGLLYWRFSFPFYLLPPCTSSHRSYPRLFWAPKNHRRKLD